MAQTKDPKGNVHAGHRIRMRENIERTGKYNLSNLHFLEYLLTFVIARADTNPIAHALLEEFKTIDQIFDASLEALMSIKGVGEKTARFLQTMSVVAFMYSRDKAIKNPKVDTGERLVRAIKAILPPSKNEQFIVLILTKDLRIKNYKIFEGVSHSLVSFDAKDLGEYLIKHKTSFCVFAHTHPDNSPTLSETDVVTFNKIFSLLDAMSITLVDNIVIGSNSYYSSIFNGEIPYANFDLYD